MSSQDKSAYVQALESLKDNSWCIVHNEHTGDLHASFMYEVEDKVINSLEFILIDPSFGYGAEIHIRESLDITKPPVDDAFGVTIAREVLEIDENTQKEEIDTIVNIAIDLAKQYKDSQVAIQFDDVAQLQDDSGEVVETNLTGYLAYNLVSYYNEESGEVFLPPIGSSEINYTVRRISA